MIDTQNSMNALHSHLEKLENTTTSTNQHTNPHPYEITTRYPTSKNNKSDEDTTTKLTSEPNKKKTTSAKTNYKSHSEQGGYYDANILEQLHEE